MENEKLEQMEPTLTLEPFKVEEEKKEEVVEKDILYTPIVMQILGINEQLEDLDNYFNELPNLQSQIDEELSDLLHYIENNKISILWAYKYIVELKKLRLERRRIKNDMFILGKYSEHKNKIISSGNRQFLMTELYKAEKQLSTPYKNRQYKDEEIEELLKKSSKKD